MIFETSQSHLMALQEVENDFVGATFEFRLKALDKAKQLGIPSEKWEDWKYSDPKVFLQTNWNLQSELELSGSEQIPRLKNWKQLDSSIRQRVLKQFERLTSSSQDPVLLLNLALASDGYVLWKKEDESESSVLNLKLKGSSAGKNLQVNWLNFIFMDAGSSAQILECFKGREESEDHLSQALSVIELGPNSSLSFVRAQAESDKAIHLGYIQAEQDQGSDLKLLSVAMGSRWSRQNWKVLQKGSDSKTQLLGVSLSRSGQHHDHRLDMRHLSPRGISQQCFKSVVADLGRSVFNGKIMIEKNAQKVDSSQISQNILLGKRAEADSKPELEIHADDVKAKHGSSTGRLDEEQLFYLTSRGLEPSEAIHLLSEGFILDVIYQLDRPALSESLLAMMDSSLKDFSKQVEAQHARS